MAIRRPVLRAPSLSGEYGQYTILQDDQGTPCLLGKGGFGLTYLARHRWLDHRAVLKVIHEPLAREPAVRARFLQEARTLARLNHPHVARLLDFGEIEGVLFYALEYCRGGDLAHYIRAHGPLPFPIWLRAARQLASALHCCHRAGYVHRDLKPGNILLAHPDGPLETKLIDFGLVQVEHFAGAERKGACTPLYASPEQLMGGEIDARSDLFAFGMTLWHLFLGTPPQAGKLAAIVADRCSAESLAPRLPAELPPAPRALLARLLEKDREQRPEGAEEVLHVLDTCAAEAPPSRAETSSRLRQSQHEEEVPEGERELWPVQTRTRALSFYYELEEEIAFSAIGAFRRARRLISGAPVWLQLLRPEIAQDVWLWRKLRAHLAGWQHAGLPGLLQPREVCAFRNAHAVIFTAPAGISLATFLQQPRVSLAPVLSSLLPHLARMADAALGLGLPGPELSEHTIFLPSAQLPGTDGQPELVPRCLAVNDAQIPASGQPISFLAEFDAFVDRLLMTVPHAKPPALFPEAERRSPDTCVEVLRRKWFSRIVNAPLTIRS